MYFTSFGERFMALLPGAFASTEDFIRHHAPLMVWDPILVDLLRLPLWLVFGFIGVLAIKLGSKPAPKFGFSSR